MQNGAAFFFSEDESAREIEREAMKESDDGEKMIKNLYFFLNLQVEPLFLNRG